MADVMPRKRPGAADADRGQLLLITALALAVILVTVALLLNAAIFTENIATRDTTADGVEAIEVRGDIVQSIGELIEAENRQGKTQPALEESVEAGVDVLNPLLNRERARRGTVVRLERNGSTTPGKLLRWSDPDTPRQFDASGATEWTLVDGLTTAREFTVDLEPGLLSDATATTSDDAFGVRFNNSGDTVTQYIYTDGSGNLVVAQAVNGTTPVRQCVIEHNGTTTVDLTGDRLMTDGSTVACYRGLWPDENPDAIEFVNGDAAEGTFAVTVDDGDVTSATSVAADNAVYSMTVDIVYRTVDLEFETTVRVAPGEPQ
jgi:hypothetical protein